MRESPIEKYLKKCVQAIGWKAYKWISPGNVGVPDDLVFGAGMVFLVELKATNGGLSATQKVQHRELAKLGFDVVVLSSKDQVREWVDAQSDALASKVTRGRTYIREIVPIDTQY